MHERYGKDGLVCMSVNVGGLKEERQSLGYLQKQGASFANYLLDEAEDLWQDKFDLNGPPAIFVFDRDNRWAKFGGDPDKPHTDKDVENLVRQLLNAAPQ